jgi:hypothetical protein
MEESEVNCKAKALELLEMFEKKFLDITYTIHPKDVENEIRGKSSNISYAARTMASRLAHSENDKRIITVMDADTCFAEDYFTSITHFFCIASPEQRKIMMFTPPTLFDR